MIQINDQFEIGNDKSITLIAGPCVIESEDFLMKIAEKIEKIVKNKIKLIFKASFDKANRQKLTSFRGIGFEEGLKVLQKVKENFGLPILTDIHEPSQAATVSEVADILQIPAFLCRQTDLLIAAAKTGKTINVKKGQFVSPKGMKPVVEKLKDAGAKQFMITERGYCFGYGNLIVDMRGLEEMKTYEVPVVFDATHAVQQPDAGGGISGGERKYVPALARAAVAVGIAGLFIEAHPDPSNAKSDATTQWPLSKLTDLIEQVLVIDDVIKTN